MDEWIKTHEQMPDLEAYQSVLIYAIDNSMPDDPGVIDVSVFNVNLSGWLWGDEGGETYENHGWTVTHWMPLPNRPDEE